MMHLDSAVDGVEAAVARAEEARRVTADHQPHRGQRVMNDPEAHSFSLFPGDD